MQSTRSEATSFIGVGSFVQAKCGPDFQSLAGDRAQFKHFGKLFRVQRAGKLDMKQLIAVWSLGLDVYGVVEFHRTPDMCITHG